MNCLWSVVAMVTPSISINIFIIKKLRPTTGPLERDGEWLTEGADMAECFIEAFSGVFSNAVLDTPTPLQTCETVLEFDGYIFDVFNIESIPGVGNLFESACQNQPSL